jgi:hypothetical protein
MILVVALVLWIVFLRSNEVYGPIAGVIFMAMLTPIFGVTGRDVQIDWRRRSLLRLNQHRVYVDDGRRTFVANIHLSV